jgi:hypothetical protein
MERRHASSLGQETRRLSGIRRLVRVSDIDDENMQLSFVREKSSGTKRRILVEVAEIASL